MDISIIMNNLPIQDTLPGLSALWAETKGLPEVSVAVLDGPVELKHDCLKTARIKQLDDLNNGAVRSFHGSFVTSLIFAHHQSPVQGISPNCTCLLKTLYHEKSDGSLMSCSQADIAQAIFDALENHADIINISGGELISDGNEIIPILANALEQCERQNVLVIAATGNEGDESMHAPAGHPTVLAVGSMNKEGTPSGFSNWTQSQIKHGILVPGENIVGAMPAYYPEDHSLLQGTSFSTALLSGIAALFVSLQIKHGSKKDLHMVRRALISTVIPCTEAEGINCDRVLAGRLNIPAAMQFVLNNMKSSVSLKENADKKVNTSTVINITNSKTNEPIAIQADTGLSNLLKSKEINMSNEIQSEPESVTPEAMASVDAQVVPASTPAVTNSSCECTSSVQPSHGQYNPSENQGSFPTFENSQLVLAIGQPSYDFGIEANLDIFKAYMLIWYEQLTPDDINSINTSLGGELTSSPFDQKSMAAYLLFKHQDGSFPNLFMSSQLIWLMSMNAVPMYSISPRLTPFSNAIYLVLAQFLADNVGLDYISYQRATSGINEINEKLDPNIIKECIGKVKQSFKNKKQSSSDVMRMSLPGYISGQSQLMNRNMVQSVTPVAYGLSDWNVDKLVYPSLSKGVKTQVENILNRLYVTAVNKGVTPDERALNYSLINIITIQDIITEAAKAKMQFSHFNIKASAIQRQHSIVREVQLTFFDPADTRKASTTYSMSVDVSGITPIIIGNIDEWFSPVTVSSTLN